MILEINYITPSKHSTVSAVGWGDALHWAYKILWGPRLRSIIVDLRHLSWRDHHNTSNITSKLLHKNIQNDARYLYPLSNACKILTPIYVQYLCRTYGSISNPAHIFRTVWKEAMSNWSAFICSVLRQGHSSPSQSDRASPMPLNVSFNANDFNCRQFLNRKTALCCGIWARSHYREIYKLSASAMSALTKLTESSAVGIATRDRLCW